jgi:hypothetical protein
MNYISVGNLDEGAKKVTELGGRVVSERREVGGHGSFQVVADPDGNAFALWQYKTPPKEEAAPKKLAVKKSASKTSKRTKRRR